MKIRIKDNSVRFRLTKSEVAKFSETGHIESSTSFASSTFYYALQGKADIAELQADFALDRITIYVPEHLQKEWATNTKVGYSNHFSAEGPNTLSLLIEKDFTCMDATTEDQSDHYPNPKLG
ncbi:Hypothetical protein I595_2844 [Croceitalea dokdonensis DOKDO 023]|uniref:Uncharacterized protein n=1 Tax=Croceitalea dokdonensis DOKDO 023 TaxID=1300341 RepID=A0A0P7ASN3_9FLAO|nr:hypothetical protein [Croceitalea dokdonensis]KPM30867.1 Hypothetical protein I595_2844 [Croceitalea dokdonensis DOKDO 023]